MRLQCAACVLALWLWVGKGMLSVRCFCFNESSFVMTKERICHPITLIVKWCEMPVNHVCNHVNDEQMHMFKKKLSFIKLKT